MPDQALQDARGLNNLILASSRDCIVVLDLDGNTLFVSPGGIEAMEVADVDTIIGLSWLRVWAGEDNAAARAAVAEARAGGVGRFQGFCPTHSGAPKWWDVVISPLPGRDGAPDRLVSIGRDITAQRLAADALREAEARVRLAQEIAGIGAFEVFVETDDFVASDQFFRIFGIAPRGRTPCSVIAQLVLPEDAAAFPTYESRLSGMAMPRTEYRFKRPDNGEIRWIERQANYLPADAGNPARVLGIARDVTERKTAELRQAALLELGDRLRDTSGVAEMAAVATRILGPALRLSRSGYATVDSAMRTVAVEADWRADPSLPSMAGRYDVSALTGWIEPLFRGESVAVAAVDQDHRTVPRLAALTALGSMAVLNVPVMHDGAMVAILFAHDSVRRVWSPDERDFVRTIADRTWAAMEQTRAEAELRAINETLETLVAERTRERDRAWRNSRDLQLVTDEKGIIHAVNDAWTEVLGWREDELLGRPFMDFVLPEDHPGTSLALTSAASAKLANHENRYRHKEGGWRWIAWVAAPEEELIYASGRHVSQERAAADALAAMQEQLRQSQKMEAVGQLTGGLAHDFNNLLTGITGSLELLRTRVAQGRVSELDRYLNAAQSACKRAAALTHRLLAFSRRQTLDPKPTDVNRLVAGMEELIRRTVGPAIELEVVGAAGIWTTLIDPGQLENALLNLCINARDAMVAGGRLTIETANKWLDERAGRERDLPPGQYVSVCVTDTGTGMSPDVASRAFDPFFTTKPLGEGTGLGLSMVYGFARQSDGQVRIYSELGHGTTMCLYLPRHRGAAEDSHAETEQAAGTRAEQGETVLVIDDEPTVRMLVAEVLSELGYIVLEAGDGPAGLKLLRSPVRIDLLVTDVGLPGGLNGRQVADAARVARPGLKVLFMTGYAENAVVGNGHLEPGMQVLTKPFSMEALGTRVKDLIGREAVPPALPPPAKPV